MCLRVCGTPAYPKSFSLRLSYRVTYTWHVQFMSCVCARRFLNEMEHGLNPELYTLEYDNMVLAMKAMAPIGTKNMNFMALALENS